MASQLELVLDFIETKVAGLTVSDAVYTDVTAFKILGSLTGGINPDHVQNLGVLFDVPLGRNTHRKGGRPVPPHGNSWDAEQLTVSLYYRPRPRADRRVSRNEALKRAREIRTAITAIKGADNPAQPFEAIYESVTRRYTEDNSTLIIQQTYRLDIQNAVP